MLPRRPPKPLRIPHPVAALAALVLLITAWTGTEPGPTQADGSAPPAVAASATEAVPGDGGAAEPLVERRPTARFSLMLFRFN